MSGNREYYSSDVNMTPDKVKFYRKKKFEPKVLFWIAMSPKGLSAPVFKSSSGMAVNADIYIDRCLKPGLLPFINANYPMEAIFLA